MRRMLATMVALLLFFVPDLSAARNTNNWANVKKLKRGTAVEISLWSGENLRGTIDDVTDDALNLDILDRDNPQISLQHAIRRASIHTIATTRHLDLPNSNRWMLTGAVAGAGVGLVAGGIVDATHGTNYRWAAGGFGGAILGFVFSCAALAATGGVEVARDHRRGKVVYSADAPPLELPRPIQPVGSPAPPNPPAMSARKELEELQKQNGLTISFVDTRGSIGVLSFKKRTFVSRLLDFDGSGGSVSRNGSMVAVNHARTYPISMATMHPGVGLLEEYPGVRGSPVGWSYDNSRVLLMMSGPNLEMIDLTSKNVQTLPIDDLSNEEPINSQCWSPDGRQIVYGTGDGSVSRFDLAERKSTKLVKGTDPTWSPDGNWIAYRNGDAYYAIHPSGEGRKQLFHKTRAISGLWWSPDSRL